MARIDIGIDCFKNNFDEEIITTDEHPFYIIGKGFTPKESLQVGDTFQLADDKTASLIRIKEIILASGLTTSPWRNIKHTLLEMFAR